MKLLRSLEKKGYPSPLPQGDENDRMDISLGTPKNAIKLGTSKAAGEHGDGYMLFNEESAFPMVDITGITSEGGGGAVFGVGRSVGLGLWRGKDFNNGIAKVTGNGLRELWRRGRERKGV